MKPIVRPNGVSGYGAAVERLQRELIPTLRALDEIAADAALVDEHEEALTRLQYRLHTAAELVLGLASWPELEEAHGELYLALSVAQEETGGLVEALDDRSLAEAVALVWEWRVALFGARLALHRLTRQPRRRDAQTAAAAAEPRPSFVPVVLLAAGVAAVLGGALAELWPVWAVGLAVVGASAGLARRVP
ncbi:MAG: hypothetical protein H0T13_03590 [Actinobacteria bacterium]|nr:hypothetical protein [Actinomycetota bacterium]